MHMTCNGNFFYAINNLYVQQAIIALQRISSITPFVPKQRYNDFIMGAMAYQVTGVWVVWSTVCAGVYQRKHQNSVSLDFLRGIHRWPMDSAHKGPVTQKMFPFDDLFMSNYPKRLAWLGSVHAVRRHIFNQKASWLKQAYLKILSAHFGEFHACYHVFKQRNC